MTLHSSSRPRRHGSRSPSRDRIAPHQIPPARAVAAWLVVAACVLLPAPVAHAQVTTATLSAPCGNLTGAIVPGASVVAATTRGLAWPARPSDDGGEFVLSALPNGTYSVKIDLAGFKTHRQQGAWSSARARRCGRRSPSSSARWRRR